MPDLHAQVEGTEGAAGTVEVTFTLSNTSPSACVMWGYPGALLLGAYGSPLTTTVKRGGNLSFLDFPVATIQVAAGSAAYFNLGYSDVASGGGNVPEVLVSRDNATERCAATGRPDPDRRMPGGVALGVAGVRVRWSGDPDDCAARVSVAPTVKSLPFGTWPSPITAEALGTSRISVTGLQMASGACWWTESRPELGGLQVLVRRDLQEPESEDPRGGIMEVLPRGIGVRSRVHEYGGGSFFVFEGGVLYTDQADQGLWLLPHRDAGAPGEGESPIQVRLSPEPPGSEEHRYADARAIPGTSLVVALKETHKPGAQDDELVVLDLNRPGSAPQVLVSGRDFFAAPRPSPDGRRLAWLAWDLPGMPWDGCELWVADLGTEGSGVVAVASPVLRIAGGSEESVGQATWLSEDELVFVSDRSGFWQPYVWSPEIPVRRVCEIEAEFHYPDWTLGQSTIAALEGSKLACRMERDGHDSVVILDLDTSASGTDGLVRELEQPCVSIRALGVAGGEVIVSGSTSTQSGVIVGVIEDQGRRTIASTDTGRQRKPADTVSRPESMEFETAGGVLAQLNFYTPVGRTPEGDAICGSPGELPPVVVQCHGGPTASAESGFDPVVQFWTTRGFAVAAVNYRGSAGRGREFRKLLDGNWGTADAEDCLAALDFLAGSRLIDRNRAVIRGGSSGGLTALRALSLGRTFAGALVTSGVTDLRALATDTHKFESGYLEGLVGPYPAEEQRYVERSPACRPELIKGAVLLLQGDEDAIVPPAQAGAMAEALRASGGRCDHVVFPGEGHGFRRAETISAAAELELGFVKNILGIGSDPRDIPPA